MSNRCAFCRVIISDVTSQAIQIVRSIAAYTCTRCAPQRPGLTEPNVIRGVPGIKAPWSAKEVQSLKGYQSCENFCSYICPAGHDLEVSKEQLYCEPCQYFQDWAYPWTLNEDYLPNRGGGPPPPNANPPQGAPVPRPTGPAPTLSAVTTPKRREVE